ncbi:MAG: hypothetical protein H6965_03110 [Chromatiaceae bacterium]|nr:hypothetical protein [Chromatiaceae bacterium]
MIILGTRRVSRRRAFQSRLVFILTAFLLKNAALQAGTVIDPGGISPLALDGLNDDFVTIQNGGIGNLTNGTANVGVEPLTAAGNLTIRSGGLLDGSNVSTGTLNVGPALVLENNGQMKLNADIVQVQGRSDTGPGTFDVSGGSSVDSNASSITVNGSVKIRDAGTRFSHTGGSLTASGQLRVTGGAEASLNQLDVTAESATLEHPGSRLSIADGSLTTTGNRVYLTDNAAYTHASGMLNSFSSLEVRDGSTAELTDVDVTVGQNMTVTDGASGGSSYVQTSGSLSIGTGWDVYGGSAMTLTGVVLDSGDAGVIHNNATFQQSGGSLHSFNSLEVRDGSTAGLTDVDVTVGQNMTVTDGASGGSGYVQTGGSLSIGTGWDVYGGSAMTLTGVALDSGDAGVIHNNATFEQSGGSITTGGRFEVNASTALLASGVNLSTGTGWGIHLVNGTDFDQTGGNLISGAKLEVKGAATTANLTDTQVILASDLQVSDGAAYTQAETGAGTTLNVGGQLRVTGGAEASLNQLDVTAESVTLEHPGSSLSITDGALTTTGNRVYLTDNATYTQASGSLNSFSSFEVRDGSTAGLTDVDVTVGQNMTVTDGASGGSGYVQTGGSLSIDTGWDVYGGSAMTLTGVVLDSGDAGVIHNNATFEQSGGSITTGGRFEVNASNASLTGVDLATQNSAGVIVNNGGSLDITASSQVQTKAFIAEGSGTSALIHQSTLTAETLDILNDALWSEVDAIINITGNTTTVSGGSTMILDGGTLNEAGDLILDGSLTGTHPILNIGSDLIVGATGSIGFTGAASISVGDDFLVDQLASGLINLGSTTLTMRGLADDESNGFLLGLGAVLDTLILDGIDLILTQNLDVATLILDVVSQVDLNGFMLTVSSGFSGDIAQIIDTTGGGAFVMKVPAPAPLLLIATGLLPLLLRRERLARAGRDLQRS